MKLKIALEWFINPDHLPFIAGIENGTYKQAGLDVELITPTEHYDGFEELKTGKIDLHCNEPLHLFEHYFDGLKSLGCFFETRGGVMIRANSVDKLKANQKIKITTPASNQIKTALATASGKVRIIEQFSDFLAETNKNMYIYFWVLFCLVAGSAFTVAFSVPDLLKCFESYDTFITTLGAKATSWQIINFAFGLLIVKLPWALCLSAVFTGMYSLIKGVFADCGKASTVNSNAGMVIKNFMGAR